MRNQYIFNFQSIAELRIFLDLQAQNLELKTENGVNFTDFFPHANFTATHVSEKNNNKTPLFQQVSFFTVFFRINLETIFFRGTFFPDENPVFERVNTDLSFYQIMLFERLSQTFFYQLLTQTCFYSFYNYFSFFLIVQLKVVVSSQNLNTKRYLNSF